MAATRQELTDGTLIGVDSERLAAVASPAGGTSPPTSPRCCGCPAATP
ncbi:hypothetical protein ACFQY4_40150 [Catellatospora bangladeshensis]